MDLLHVMWFARINVIIYIVCVCVCVCGNSYGIYCLCDFKIVPSSQVRHLTRL